MYVGNLKDYFTAVGLVPWPFSEHKVEFDNDEYYFLNLNLMTFQYSIQRPENVATVWQIGQD